MIPRLTPGKLAPVVEQFVFDMIQEVQPTDTEGVEVYLEALKTCPILGTVLEVKTLIALQLLGEYSHPDEEIQEFIQQQFKNIDGSFKWSFAEMYAAEALGYAYLEIEWLQKDGQWNLASLRALDPQYYNFIGSEGRVKGARYQSQKGQIDIPIDKAVLITNRKYLTYGDPYGVATLRQALSSWRAWKILMGQMLIAGQRQSTGVIVGYAPSRDSVPLYNEDGSPSLDDNGEQITMPAPDALNKQLQGLENGSILSTDLNNRIEMLSQQANYLFFREAISACESNMLKAFAFPDTLLSAVGGGSGDSNLNGGHRELLEITVKSTVEQITEEVMEKIIRPLIFWNFGEQEDYGEFKQKEAGTENKEALMQLLINAVTSGFFSAADMDVINKGRELVGLPILDNMAEIEEDDDDEESDDMRDNLQQLSKAIRY